MPHDGSLLQATVVFLLAVVLLVPLAQRLKMGRYRVTCWRVS